MTEQELIEKVGSVWEEPGHSHRDWKRLNKFAVEVERGGAFLTVTVSQMYEFLPLKFADLEKLAAIFETKVFDVNNWASGGCETCDFGSCYRHVFTGIPSSLLSEVSQ